MKIHFFRRSLTPGAPALLAEQAVEHSNILLGGDIEQNPGPDDDDEDDEDAFLSKPNPRGGLASFNLIGLLVSLVSPLGEFAASASTVTRCG